MYCRSNGQRCPQFQRVPRENQAERWWQQLYRLGPEPEDHPHSCQERLWGPLMDLIPKMISKRRRTYEMFQGLKLGFQARAHVKRYKTSDDFLSRQTKGEKLNCWACAQIVRVQQSFESSGSWSSRWDSDVSLVTITKLLELRDEL